MSEIFSFKKFFGSFAQGLSWIKSVALTIRIVIIGMIVFSIISTINSFLHQDSSPIKIGKIEKGASVVIQQDNSTKKTGLEFEATSVDIQGILCRYFQKNWAVGIGARYEWDNQEIRPVVKVRWEF